MNKFLIILLAVCLVSVHAFVKRDAPEADKNENYVQTLQKQFEDFSKGVNAKLGEAFDPEKIKQGLDQFTDTMKKALDDIKAKTNAKE